MPKWRITTEQTISKELAQELTEYFRMIVEVQDEPDTLEYRYLKRLESEYTYGEMPCQNTGL